MFSDVVIKSDPFQGVDAAFLNLVPISLGRKVGQDALLLENSVERRAFQRFATDAVALVCPVDAEFRATGPAFQALIVDLSAGGLRLQHNEYVESPLIAVKLRLPDAGVVTLALSVLRSQPKDGCFEIAGRVIAKLECGDEAWPS